MKSSLSEWRRLHLRYENRRLFEVTREDRCANFPTASEVERSSEPPTTSREYKIQVDDAREVCKRRLHDFSKSQAQRYIQDALEFSRAYEDTAGQSLPEDPVDWPEELRNQWSVVINPHHHQRSSLSLRLTNETDVLIGVHHSSVKVPLDQIRRRQEQELARRKQDTKDAPAAPLPPRTVEEYKSLKDTDRPRAVALARYLTVPDASTQERILNQLGWSSRALAQIAQVYTTNFSFQADIRAYVKSFEVTDPRRRNT